MICFRMFAWTASLHTVDGIVWAWLLSLAIGHPLRSWAAWQAEPLVDAEQQRRDESVFIADFISCDRHKLGVLAAAAASSSLILVLSNLLLKLELQERGANYDAALYSWHIATFFLGAGFAPAASILLHRRRRAAAPSHRTRRSLKMVPTRLLRHLQASALPASTRCHMP